MSPSLPRSTTGVLVVAVLTVTAGFTGCIGSEEASTVEPASSPEPATPNGTAAFPGTATETTLWRNGSFAPTDHAEDPAEPFPGVAVQRVPLTAEIPQGSPVHVDARLSYEAPLESATSGRTNTVALQLETGDGVAVVGEEDDDEAGRERVTATVVRFGDGPVEVLVQNLLKPQPEYAYTLEARLSLRTATVPAGLPTAVDVPEGAAEIEVQPAGADDDLSAVAWGPEDGYLGWRSNAEGATVHYPVAEEGTHVLRTNASARVGLVDGTGDPLTPEGPLQSLRLETRLGEGHALPTGTGPETWTTPVPKAPVGVSFQVLPTGPADAGVLAGEDIRVRIATENGTVVDEPFLLPANPFAAGAPPLGDGLTGFPRTFAHPNTTAGEWTWTASYDLAAEVEVVPVWIHHERTQGASG